MNRTVKLVLILAALALVFPLAVILDLGAEAGDDPIVETRTVDLDGAATAAVEVRMDAGGLRLGPGGAGLMDGTFTYSERALGPTFNYAVEDGTGRLTVSQAAGPAFVAPEKWDEVASTWDLRLGAGIPIALDVRLGAGESVLTLGGLDLTEAAIETGAGATTVDFSGGWTRDVHATIAAGAGTVTIVVPSGVGVVVDANVGIGTVTGDGLTASGDRWRNDAYGVAPVTLEIEVAGGVGDVRLVSAPPS